jgi:hypothetical protein
MSRVRAPILPPGAPVPAPRPGEVRHTPGEQLHQGHTVQPAPSPGSPVVPLDPGQVRAVPGNPSKPS